MGNGAFDTNVVNRWVILCYPALQLIVARDQPQWRALLSGGSGVNIGFAHHQAIDMDTPECTAINGVRQYPGSPAAL